MEMGDVLQEIADFFLRRESGSSSKRGQIERPIELLDSAGRSFSEVYGSESKENKQSRETLDLTENIIFDAVRQRASDLLIDPKSDGTYTVRFRVDGFLRIN